VTALAEALLDFDTDSDSDSDSDSDTDDSDNDAGYVEQGWEDELPELDDLDDFEKTSRS
jgi:hypothetical protein